MCFVYIIIYLFYFIFENPLWSSCGLVWMQSQIQKVTIRNKYVTNLINQSCFACRTGGK